MIKKELSIKNNKKINLLSGILLMLVLFGASYAFFTNDFASVERAISFGNGLNIQYTLTADSNINYEFDPFLLAQNGELPYLDSDPASGEVYLGNSESGDITCEYEIWYHPTEVFNNTGGNDLEELVLFGEDESGQNDKFKLNLNGISEDTLLKKGYVYATGNQNKTQNWNFYLRHYNLRDVDQSGNIGESLGGGEVYFKAGKCVSGYKPITDTAVAKISSLVGTTITGITPDSGGTYSGAVVLEEDNNIRYEGLNPNNYVFFNNELWRIIGVFNEDTHGITGEQLIKIVRVEPYSESVLWDEDDSNNWNTASLQIALNFTYYNSIDSLHKEMIQPISWKIGGSTSYFDEYVPGDFYAAERNTIIGYDGSNVVETGSELPIGFAYPSDYGYAVLESSCPRTTALFMYGTTAECYSQDWMWVTLTQEGNLWSWFINPISDNDISAFVLEHTGRVLSDYVGYGNAASPVLYLKASINITDGNGTIADPYILSSN